LLLNILKPLPIKGCPFPLWKVANRLAVGSVAYNKILPLKELKQNLGQVFNYI
jgi:hypothetical protein